MSASADASLDSRVFSLPAVGACYMSLCHSCARCERPVASLVRAVDLERARASEASRQL